MTTRNEKVNIKIGAQDAGALRIINGIQKQLIGLAGAYMGFNALKSLFSSIVELGSESQLVWNDVSASLVRHGYEVENNIKKIKSFSAEMQTMTGESDELIGKSIKMFIDYGNSIEKSFDIMKTAADLAAGADMNLESAVDLLNKASVGYTGTLSRYGIIIDENIPKTQKFAAAIKQIEDRFGGAAASRADSFAVKIKLLNERFGDLQEEIFNLFSPGLTGAVEGATSVVNAFLSLFEDEPEKRVEDLSSEYKTLAERITDLNKAFKEGKIYLDEYRQSITDAMRDATSQTETSSEKVVQDIINMSRSAQEAAKKLFEAFKEGLIPADVWVDASAKVNDIFDTMLKRQRRELDHWEWNWRYLWQQRLVYDTREGAEAINDVLEGLYRQNIVFENLDLLKEYLIKSCGFTSDEVNKYFSGPLEKALDEAVENIKRRESELKFITKIKLDDEEFLRELEENLDNEKNIMADHLMWLNQNYTRERIEQLDEIIEANKKALEEQLAAQKKFNDAVGNLLDNYSDQWIDVLLDQRSTAQDIWKAMANDFAKLFIKNIIAKWAATIPELAGLLEGKGTLGNILGAAGTGFSILGPVGGVIGGIIGSVLKQNVGMINGDNLLGGTSRQAVTIVNNYYQGVVTQDFISKDVIPSVSIASKRKETSIIGIEAGKLGGSLVFSN